LKRPQCGRGKPIGKAVEQFRPRLDQDHACGRGIDVAEISPQYEACKFCDGSRPSRPRSGHLRPE
jgi:hypothetical protein